MRSIQSTVLASFYVTWHKKESLDKRKFWQRKCFRHIYVYVCSYACVFLIGNWYGDSQLTLGYVTPGQVVLDAVRKQIEKARRSKPGTGVPPWSLLLFLPWVLALSSLLAGQWFGSVSWNTLSPPPSCFLVVSFITAIQTLTQTLRKSVRFGSNTWQRHVSTTASTLSGYMIIEYGRLQTHACVNKVNTLTSLDACLWDSSTHWQLIPWLCLSLLQVSLHLWSG